MILTLKEYEKRFLMPKDRVSDEQRKGIIEDARSEKVIPVYKIAAKWKVESGKVSDIIKNYLGEKKYYKKWKQIGIKRGQKIIAPTFSTTFIEQKEDQEDAKESEPTSERDEESHNNNDIKDSGIDSKNLNKDTKSKDLEDLIDKAIEEFKILKDPKLKELIKKYDGGIVYKGTHFTKKFIKFIKSEENDALTKEEKNNLVKRIDEFNENKNIDNLLEHYIKYTKFSKQKIYRKLKEMNFKIGRGSLTTICHKILTQKEYEKRFPSPDDWVSDEQREGIIKAGRSKNPDSLDNIADEFGVAVGTVRKIIIKDLGEKEYHTKFHREISDEQRKGIIKAGHSEDPDSIRMIASEFGVAIGTAIDIIQNDLGDKVYHKKFPEPADWVSDEQREGIIKAGRSKDLDTITKIAETWRVAWSTARVILQDNLEEEEFNKLFQEDISKIIGQVNHKLIEKIVTQDLDEKRKKSPDVPILFSEPQIYPSNQKRCDNAFKNDKKYLQKLLKDRIAEELKIDPKKLDHIKVVFFDYTSSLKKNTIMDKIEKYQHSKIMLFIVGIYWYHHWIGRVKKLPKDKGIKYPENIRIIKWDLFADLLNLSNDNRKKFKEIIELTRLRGFDTLKKLNEQNNYKLHRLKNSKTRKKGSKDNLDAFLSKI